jgi:hypothetical protein
MFHFKAAVIVLNAICHRGHSVSKIHLRERGFKGREVKVAKNSIHISNTVQPCPVQLTWGGEDIFTSAVVSCFTARNISALHRFLWDGHIQQIVHIPYDDSRYRYASA